MNSGKLLQINLQIEGKTNIKCCSKVLGHQVPPEQLQCTLALILQVSTEGIEHHSSSLEHDSSSLFPHYVLMMVVESAV